MVDAWTTSADVESTKPAPDLVQAALDKTGDEPGGVVMVRDTPWDVQAASEAGVETITVITGGFSEQSRPDQLVAGVVAVLGQPLPPRARAQGQARTSTSTWPAVL